MKNFFILKFVFLLISILLFGFNVNAQKVEMETTNLEIKNNKLVISYDFTKFKKSQTFEVWIEISTLSKKQINATSLTGDIGKTVTSGIGKQIIWDYVADGVLLNEEINVEVKAILNVPIKNNSASINLKPILLSALVPGLGLTNIDKGKPYWIMGVATYGLIVGSVIMNKNAVADYDSYLAENNDYNKSEDFLKNSETKDQNSKIMAYSSAGIWAVSMVWTIIKAKKQGKSVTSILNTKKVFFYSGINPRTKSAGFTLKYRF